MKPVALHELNVIGYADALRKDMLPTTVPPIYELQVNPASVLFPPFHIEDATVTQGTLADKKEFLDYCSKREVTAIPTPMAARADHILWIDENWNAHYEDSATALKNLNKIANEATEKAEALLKQGDLRSASRQAHRAIATGTYKVYPFAILGAIAKKQNKPERIVVWRELAKRCHEVACFDVYLEQYHKDIKTGHILSITSAATISMPKFSLPMATSTRISAKLRKTTMAASKRKVSHKTHSPKPQVMSKAKNQVKLSQSKLDIP